MELKDLLPAVIIIACAIVGVSFIASILTTMQTNIGTDTVTGESTTFSTASAVSLVQNDLVAASETLTCNSLAAVRDTDYTIDNAAGTYLGLSYPRTSTTYVINFTSLHDENVTLTKTPRINTSTLVVWNCSNNESFLQPGNYTAYSNGKINVTSTGTILNNTVTCYNVTYGYAVTGDTCSIDYTYNPDESSIISLGLTGISAFGNWWSILITVLVAVIVIGIIMKFKGRDK